MSYKYYIVSLFNGDVTGTDNMEIANSSALSEECFVINTSENKWLMADGTAEDVPECIEDRDEDGNGEDQ